MSDLKQAAQAALDALDCICDGYGMDPDHMQQFKQLRTLINNQQQPTEDQHG